MKEDIPEQTKLLGKRFVLAINNVGTENEVYKPRFLCRGAQTRKNIC